MYCMPFRDYNSPCLNVSDETLMLIKSSVKGEKEDELFYDYLIQAADDDSDKEIIASIRDDERKHNKMFRSIYKDLTGEDIKSDDNVDFQKPDSYFDGLKKAFFGELKAVEKYRKIYAGLPIGPYRDMLFEIITDELKHADKYNYLITMNKGILNRGISSTSDTNSSSIDLDDTYDDNSITMCHDNYKIFDEEIESNEDIIDDFSSSERDDFLDSTELDSDYTSSTYFSPNDWVDFISPIVDNAITNINNSDTEKVIKEAVLEGILTSLGYSAEDSIKQIDIWTRSGKIKLS